MSDIGGVDFNFSFAPGVLDEQILGFELAGDVWSQYLHDTYKGEDLDINLYVAVGDDILPDDVVGGAFPAIETGINYRKIYRALKKDRTTENDDIAFDSLLNKNKFDVLVGDNIVGKNKDMQATRANLKALGLIKKKHLDQLDGFIVMNSLVNAESVSWNYNYLEDPQEGEIDFLSVAMHEIGHNLGFFSGIDIYAWNEESTDYDGNKIDHMSPLDLFRYSAESFAVQDGNKTISINDITFGRAAYFSIDGTVDNAIAMSTGADYQGSHWANGDLETGTGLMNPTIRPGERWEISETDLKAFDVIGWDVKYDAVVNLEYLVENAVTDLYKIDLEDLVDNDNDIDDDNDINLDALFSNNQFIIKDPCIVDRADEVDEIFSGDAYKWAWRSTGASGSGYWWAWRSTGASGSGYWWAWRSTGASGSGYWSTYNTDALSTETSSNDNSDILGIDTNTCTNNNTTDNDSSILANNLDASLDEILETNKKEKKKKKKK